MKEEDGGCTTPVEMGEGDLRDPTVMPRAGGPPAVTVTFAGVGTTVDTLAVLGADVSFIIFLYFFLLILF